jgi:hypothetical protein
MPGHALALQHEGPLIAAAVNRYFGYVLVRDVKLSLEPMTKGDAPAATGPYAAPEPVRKAVGEALTEIEGGELKEALRTLGERILNRSPR